MAATEPVVWIIDAQQWPRAYLRAELIERRFDAVGYILLADALAALRNPNTPKPRVIVLELREQPMSEELIAALARTGITTIVLGGSAEFNQQMVGDFEWAAVMKRPFTLGAVADKVQELALS